MITQLRFKNWRSLKDVTIDDLQPINVFIGANSSGKTNILDAIRFRRSGATIGWSEAVFNWGGRSNIQSLGVKNDGAIEIGMAISPSNNSSALNDFLKLEFDDEGGLTRTRTINFENRKILLDSPLKLPLGSSVRDVEVYIDNKTGASADDSLIGKYVNTFIKERIQLLDEGFITPTLVSALASKDRQRNLYVVDSDASNVMFILEYVKQNWPQVFIKLQDDLAWLLAHVQSIDIRRTDREIELLLKERILGGEKAPTISAGTSRIIAMLTAVYALDLHVSPILDEPSDNKKYTFLQQTEKQMPGVIIVDEPDTALNPGLLRRFVEQIRNYAQGENPRQFIFTTHNPTFLDFFEPEEVRVVERDENGYTTVNKIPDYIREIWLKDGEYGLGEVWTTRSFGGVPE